MRKIAETFHFTCKKTILAIKPTLLHIGIMILTLAPRSRQEIDNEIKLLRRNVRKILKTKASARKFLIDHGFITKAGKLTKKYGG
jgi:hypothetical protein